MTSGTNYFNGVSIRASLFRIGFYGPSFYELESFNQMSHGKQMLEVGAWKEEDWQLRKGRGKMNYSAS